MKTTLAETGAAGSHRPRVVVVGAGFGGLAAVRALRQAPVEVLFIDGHNYHQFTPLLYQLASALLDPAEIAHPIRGIVRGQPDLTVRLAWVIGGDLETRELVLDNEERIDYDYLVLAAGSVSDYFGSEHLRERTFALKNLDDALRLRRAVLGRFEEAAWTTDQAERRRLLTFAIVGGGPTGVEYAGALSELVHLIVPRDFPTVQLNEVRMLLINGAKTVLTTFPGGSRNSARQALERKGVELVLGVRVEDFQDDRIHLSDGRELAVGLVVWTAGVRGAGLGARLGVPTGHDGRLTVMPTLQLAGHPEVFVVGDLAACMADGRPLPMLSPVALQEGDRAGRNIAALVNGESPTPFRYFDRGTMATIGRNAAVAKIGRLHLGGRLAWFAWLFLHLVLLIGFRNRLAVFINWAWSYVFYDRPIRLMIGQGGWVPDSAEGKVLAADHPSDRTAPPAAGG